MAEQRFLRPVDVLYLRGNRLFGEAGAHSEAEMPPWPTVAAGALRSRMLVDAGVAPETFAGNGASLGPELERILGTPERPGTFTLSTLLPARRKNGSVEPLFPLPADVIVHEEKGTLDVHRLDLDVGAERLAQHGLMTGYPLPQLPVLRRREAGKPVGGLWLTPKGLQTYLRGGVPGTDQLLRSGEFWKIDPRLGIALDGTTRTARTGALYTSEAVAPDPDFGFFVDVRGADGHVPRDGLLRFGGDGRAVVVETADVTWPPEPDWERIEGERRFLLILRTPGIFPGGWRLPGLDDQGLWHGPAGLRARLVTAVVPRARVVSGWNLARGCPKPAQRTVPVGAVYGFADVGEGARDALGRLLEEGLWSLLPDDDPWAQRRAEGFGHVLVANWPRTAE